MKRREEYFPYAMSCMTHSKKMSLTTSEPEQVRHVWASAWKFAGVALNVVSSTLVECICALVFGLGISVARYRRPECDTKRMQPGIAKDHFMEQVKNT